MIAFLAFLTILTLAAAVGGDYPDVRNGRPAKVGVDHHSGLCFDTEGKCECVCGLFEREAAEIEHHLEQLAHYDGLHRDRGDA